MDRAFDIVPAFALVLFRIAGLFVFAPLFGSSRIPRRMKALFALVMALAIFPAVGRHVRMPEDSWSLAVAIGGEIIFGAAMGMITGFVFIAAQWAGEIIGQQMGLNISEVLDPQYGKAGSLIGDLYFMLTMAVFLSPPVNGHRYLVMAVRGSFDTVPLLTAGVDRSMLDLLAGLFMGATSLAIQLAAPMLMTMLVVDVALGVIGRAMPQMNVMSLALTVRSIIGIVILLLGLMFAAQVLQGASSASTEMTLARWMTK